MDRRKRSPLTRGLSLVPMTLVVAGCAALAGIDDLRLSEPPPDASLLDGETASTPSPGAPSIGGRKGEGATVPAGPSGNPTEGTEGTRSSDGGPSPDGPLTDGPLADGPIGPIGPVATETPCTLTGTCSCAAGEACPTGLVCCSGLCVDVSSEVNHCGVCSNRCVGGRICTDGQCTCGDGDPYCSATCPDFFKDPNHCGSCRHSCFGGACLGGACQPVALVSGQESVASVVLAAGNVYYASEDGQLLGRVAKQGPACVGSACLTADVSFKPSLLATDGVSIFAASSEANGVLAQFDTGLSKSITLSTVSKVTHLVAGGGRVFWASDEGKTLVRSIPVNGGAVAEVVTLPPSDDARVTALATDGNQLVWAVEKQTSPPSYGIYRVGVSKSCSFATCVPLVTTSDRVTSLALDSEFVYFASKDGAVRKVLKAGGCGGISPCPIVLAERQPDPSTVLVDDDSLYWAAGDGTVRVSSVYRLCRGSRCQAIAGRLGAILGLARDERGIFMAVQDSLVMAGGAVYFIANRK